MATAITITCWSAVWQVGPSSCCDLLSVELVLTECEVLNRWGWSGHEGTFVELQWDVECKSSCKRRRQKAATVLSPKRTSHSLTHGTLRLRYQRFT